MFKLKGHLPADLPFTIATLWNSKLGINTTKKKKERKWLEYERFPKVKFLQSLLLNKNTLRSIDLHLRKFNNSLYNSKHRKQQDHVVTTSPECKIVVSIQNM